MIPLRARGDLGAMAMKGYSTFLHFRKLYIRLFSVISRILIGEVLSLCKEESVYSTAPTDWASVCVCVYVDPIELVGHLYHVCFSIFLLSISLSLYIYIYVYTYDLYYECWLSLNHFVGMCQTKCNIIWRVLNI